MRGFSPRGLRNNSESREGNALPTADFRGLASVFSLASQA
jgi:hypothetical protein